MRRLYAILKSVAPEAEEAIKWGTPFFAHLSFAPTAAAAKHKTTKGTLQIPYDKPVPEALVRKIAEYCLRDVRERGDDAFW